MEQKMYNLTNPQRAIYLTEQFYKGTSIGNVCGTLLFKEKVDFTLLEKALNIFVERNDASRIKLKLIDTEPKQYIEKYSFFNIDLVEVKNKEELERVEENIISTPFELFDSLLFKFTIIKFPDGTGGYNANFHHMISDAWSMKIFIDEIVDTYTKLINNQEINLEPEYSYTEYIKREQEYIESTTFTKDKEYWGEKFDVIPELATLNTTGVKSSSRADRKEFKLNTELTNKLKEFSTNQKTSPFTLFVAIFSFYLSRVTRIDEVVTGAPILNRANFREKNTPGMFVSTMPFKVEVEQELSFEEYLRKLSKEQMTLFRHQKYHYDYIIEDIRKKHNTSKGLYDLIISYQNARNNSKTAEVEYYTNWMFNKHVSESLNIHIYDMDDTGKFTIYYDYQVEAFDKNEIEALHERVLHMLSQITDNSEIALKDIEIVTEKEKHKLMYELNITEADYPRDKTIVQLFEEQAEKTPNNVAITFEGEELTYKELNEKANQLAHYLRKKGVVQDSTVAVRIRKSLELIIAVLGIVKSGGCYLPIDLSYPENRVEFMLEDSKTKMMLVIEEDKEFKINNKNLEQVNISLSNKKIYSLENTNLEIVNKPDDLLYIIYTSGTTGNPKGVMITHRNVVRLMKNDKFQFDFSEKDVWTMFHSVAFDFSVWEMYGALLYGGKLVVVSGKNARDPNMFLKLLRDEKVTVLNQTPTYFYNLLEQELKNPNKDLVIRYIIFGGEALKPNLVKPWKERYSFTKLINMYGITETTVHVTYKELTDVELESNESNIGLAIPTLKVYLLDKTLNLVPQGYMGEICVSGDGVCREYLNRPDLNCKKFIESTCIKGERMYRSADSAVFSSDGELFYKGRFDNQVKIRGFRIELEEIEDKLLKYKGITKCVVLEGKNSYKDSYLCAYIVCEENVEIAEVKKYLSELMPYYMVPSYFVKLDSIPLNSNGKADRKKLLSIELQQEICSTYVAPRNEFEKCLVDTIEEVLKTKNVGIDDDIFMLGADSLRIMQILTRIVDKNYNISIQDFYDYRTIRNINDKVMLKIQKSKFEELNIDKYLYYDFDDEFSEEKAGVENILLTGATGFLGIHMLKTLLKNTNCNVYCLIRSKNKQTPEERLENKLKYYFNSELDSYVGKRIFIINGNIIDEKLSLGKKEYERLTKKIDKVIHSAALVKHYGDVKMFEKINIDGTRNIIKFCKDGKATLSYISTTSVAGLDISEDGVKFDERSLYVGQNYKINAYIYSKFMAEYNIWLEMQKGLNAIIFRLGNITSRYEDGVFQENNMENAFLNRLISFTKLKMIPETLLEKRVDFSPVDLCSDSIIDILQYKSSYGKVFNIFNANTILVKDVINYLTDSGFVIEKATNQEFENHIKSLSKADKDKLMGLIEYISKESDIEHDPEVNIDCKFTLEYLNKLGFEWPEIDKDYIIKYIRNYNLKESSYEN